jgi:hypothetical protein
MAKLLGNSEAAVTAMPSMELPIVSSSSVALLSTSKSGEARDSSGQASSAWPQEEVT